ncbi:MAG TPA: hypothetical protein VFA47_05905, partial [Candidatus Manganitrophaceae bacterium]|nr:hypothetical protein [Candidatus Manganitrophaceae bacterium]
MGNKARNGFFLLVIFFLSASPAFAEFSRLDPLLSPGILRPGALVKGKPALGERVTVLIRFTGDLSGVTEL